MALNERWRGLWDDIRHSPARLPARVTIPTDHVSWSQETPRDAFRPDEDYFLVRVNQMYLTYGREWFVKYDPMVLVVTEFTYDKGHQTVPFVVGPNLLESRGQEAPAGMVFSDTRVAGLHPYRGDRVALSVVLSQVQRVNYAKKLLELVESAAGVLDFATALTAYVKVASVVLDGVQALLSMDDAAQPLMGHRKEFDPEGGDLFIPAFFALVDPSEEEISPEALWVRDNQLYAGESLASSKPFRESDFVLYSILKTAERRDERTLPFYPLFERVKEGATSREEADWKRAKGDMASLWQTLVLSPDLTETQAKQLRVEYRAKLEELLEEAKDMSTLGLGKQKEADGRVSALREAASILDL
jgi:hypothetical protein